MSLFDQIAQKLMPQNKEPETMTHEEASAGHAKARQEMEPKYKLLPDDTIQIGGVTLHRIQALRSFVDKDMSDRMTSPVLEGEFGGYIEHEGNLSHEGACWVSENSYVYGGAKVMDNAMICDNSIACGHAIVMGDAVVRNQCRIQEDAVVGGQTRLFNRVYVTSHATVGVTDKESSFKDIHPDSRDYENSEDRTSIRGVNGFVEMTGHASVVGGSIIGNSDIIIEGKVTDSRLTGGLYISPAASVTRTDAYGNLRFESASDVIDSQINGNGYIIARIDHGRCLAGKIDDGIITLSRDGRQPLEVSKAEAEQAYSQMERDTKNIGSPSRDDVFIK